MRSCLLTAVAWLSLFLGLVACGGSKLPVREIDVPSGDVTLYVRVVGDPGAGQTLVAVHGGPGMSSRYMRSLEQLASAELAVVTYDQRGAGRSTSPPPDPASYGWSEYVGDLETVRQAVGAGQVHLLGHSWGGVLAMRYATAYPENVRSLILVSSGPPSAEAVRAAQESRMQRIGALQQEGILPRKISGLEDLLPAYFSDPHFVLPDELRDLDYNANVEQLTWAALGEYDFTAQVAALEHPVLMLYGQDDPFGLPMAESTRDALSSADVELVVIEKCGHFWQECPGAFLAHVRAFLELPAAP
jgi:proline iminopeptidase